MIYLIFNEGYGGTPDTAAAREALADEAIRLGRLLLSLFPTDPEVFGLLALMLLQQSRAPARFDANGEIALLDEQDRSRLNRTLIDEGRLLLERASVYQTPGRPVSRISAMLFPAVPRWCWRAPPVFCMGCFLPYSRLRGVARSRGSARAGYSIGRVTTEAAAQVREVLEPY
jgi:hypothetical protein